MKITALLLFYVQSITPQPNHLVGFYKYCNYWTLTYIDIRADSTFSFYYSSCRGPLAYSGCWYAAGDTLFLHSDLGYRDTMLLVDEKYLHTRRHSSFSEFQAYSKKRVRNTRNKKDCCRACIRRNRGF